MVVDGVWQRSIGDWLVSLWTKEKRRLYKLGPGQVARQVIGGCWSFLYLVFFVSFLGYDMLWLVLSASKGYDIMLPPVLILELLSIMIMVQIPATLDFRLFCYIISSYGVPIIHGLFRLHCWWCVGGLFGLTTMWLSTAALICCLLLLLLFWLEGRKGKHLDSLICAFIVAGGWSFSFFFFMPNLLSGAVIVFFFFHVYLVYIHTYARRDKWPIFIFVTRSEWKKSAVWPRLMRLQYLKGFGVDWCPEYVGRVILRW